MNEKTKTTTPSKLEMWIISTIATLAASVISISLLKHVFDEPVSMTNALMIVLLWAIKNNVGEV